MVYKGLNRNLIIKDQDSLYQLNFDSDLHAVIKEVPYLKRISLSNIPREALDVTEQAELFRNYRALLSSAINFYNRLHQSTKKVEIELIPTELSNIDSLMSRGAKQLYWQSNNLLEYIKELGVLIEGIWKACKSSQENVEKIRHILEPWTRTPLIERKDHKKDNLLYLDEKVEKVNNRYTEIIKGAEQIHRLVAKNQILFEINEIKEQAWLTYIKYIDAIVMEALRKTICCSLSYLAENMDVESMKEPLLEARLELREPDFYYVPSLEPDDPDGLDQLVFGLLNDIIGMAGLVPRILKSSKITYKEELAADPDIVAMKNEILNSVASAVEKATDFCGMFEGGFCLFVYHSYPILLFNIFRLRVSLVRRSPNGNATIPELRSTTEYRRNRNDRRIGSSKS